MADTIFGSGSHQWVCPNDRQLALRAKLHTGWSVHTYQTEKQRKSQGLSPDEVEAILQVIQRAERLDVQEQQRIGKSAPSVGSRPALARSGPCGCVRSAVSRESGFQRQRQRLGPQLLQPGGQTPAPWARGPERRQIQGGLRWQRGVPQDGAHPPTQPPVGEPEQPGQRGRDRLCRPTEGHPTLAGPKGLQQKAHPGESPLLMWPRSPPPALGRGLRGARGRLSSGKSERERAPTCWSQTCRLLPDQPRRPHIPCPA
ncbi:PREDICTED: rab effector Noc2 isoform X4 [Myotis davidii]|uniref:rab effector Noc2 isoform X4 n=1 Tax=Myotis davidii TaxID=225400 RepID=UPI00076753AB|nr:PREDICTED: rab effector Noc2 isoform X4 [Myotis davidii]